MTPWLLTFLVAFSVAIAVMSALCWQLWRTRHEEMQRAGRQCLEDKVRSEMQPARSDGTTRADLMQDPGATVVLWHKTAYDSQVTKLSFGEVLPVQLGSRQCNGVLVPEPWADCDDELQRPFSGLGLGGT